MGKALKMPGTSLPAGIAFTGISDLQMRFLNEWGKRRIICDFAKFYKGREFHCEIELEQPEMDNNGNCNSLEGKEKGVLL